MEGVYEELDEAKAEIEKLREECKRKAELSESLKSSHREQLVKAQEASLKIEKQAQEIYDKDEEILVFKQTLEDLQRSSNEKASIIKRLTAANEKLRVDCDTKFKKWEGENLGLVSALEEANGKSFDLEQRIRDYEEEIRGLKGSLLASHKKCSEAENNSNGRKEAREREDVVISLEVGKRKIEEQLKWKKEQFSHLEEAHRKMRDQLKASEMEWESEKSSLLDEICSLQTSLDSQIRISEDLQNRLGLCNQALAREESKRKSLEVQLSDVQGRFENIFGDYEDAKSQLECLTEKRDEEIASLRHSLSKKEMVLKEMEYQKRQMEQENEELQISLKELRESQIQKSPGSASLAKLQNKLKCSEHMRKESTANLKAKEAELNSQLEKMTQELNNYRSELESKDEQISELRMELKQLHEDIAKHSAKEAEKNSELENMTRESNNYRSELESKDERIIELRMELKQLHEDIAKHSAKEAEKNSELEQVNSGLIHYKSEVESRDVIIEELRMALEQIHTDSTANFQAREVEWKARLETMVEDLIKCRSQLQSKDELILDVRTEMEQLHEEYIGKLGAKETEKNSQLERVTNDLNNYRSMLETRDGLVRELRMELEQIRGESAAQFEAREAEWKVQEETMEEDLKKHRSQLERKDQMLKELKMELEQREDYAAQFEARDAKWKVQEETMEEDLKKYRSQLERKDQMLKELKMELEQREDYCANISAKEAEGVSQLEKATNELINYMSELDRRDLMIKALGSELDEVRRDFIADLKSKETEWKLQIESMRSVLDDKDAEVKQLRTDLEDCRSLQNEENSVMLMVLKNGISEAQLKIAKEKVETERSDREKEESISVLRQLLEMKNSDIDRLQNDVGKECEKISALLRRVESLEIDGHQQHLLMQKELDTLVESLMESSICELFVREQLLQNEGELRKKLKSNEAEWKYQLEVMRSVVDEEETRVKQLRTDLEDSHSSRLQLKLQNEESSVMLMVLKNGISEAQLKIGSEKVEVEKSSKEKEERISVLSKKLEMKNADVETLQRELEKHEAMLMESSIRELFVSEQLLQNEGALRKKLRSVYIELDRANTELAEKICDGNGMEFELYIWKSIAERFKAGLEEGFEMRKELEASLLAQVVVAETIELEKQSLLRMLEEKDKRVDDLQQQVTLLEQNLRTSEKGASSFELEKSRYLQVIEDNKATIEEIEREVGCLEQESLRREYEEFLLAKIGEERIVQTNKEKVNDLMQLVGSLEDKYNTSLMTFSTELVEKQAEINLVCEAWERITAAEIMAAIEIEEKKLLIVELEDDIRNVEQKLKLEQQSTCDLQLQALEVEAKLGAKAGEMKRVSDELKTRLEKSDTLIEELKSEKRSLVENVTKLLSERENILRLVGRLDDTIGEFSSTDENLMEMLEGMMASCEDDHCLLMGLSLAEKENLDSPTVLKKVEASSDLRSPFREINNQKCK